MHVIYDMIMALGKLLLTLVSRCFFLPECKLLEFARGQQGALREIKISLQGGKGCSKPVLWVHAASLGEYGVARPVVRQLRDEYCIVLTFFSPTGYEAMKYLHLDVDYVFLLPLDTRKNAAAFLDTVCPQKAMFVISEYWVNYMEMLKRNCIPVCLVSALIHREASLFKWYGALQRKALKNFTYISVLDEVSAGNLRNIGCSRVCVTGDPLFDNALAQASTPYRNMIVEHFARGRKLFIAGSTSDDNDLELVCSLANRHRDTLFLIVPHEISAGKLNDIKTRLDGDALCYSECDEQTDFENIQVLIIDYIGELALLYRYGNWVYVGGGFTPYLHSVIEATVYGLPVSFGPETRRKLTPKQLEALKIGAIVRSADELDAWFCNLKGNCKELERIRRVALDYSEANSGATAQIVKIVKEL